MAKAVPAASPNSAAGSAQPRLAARRQQHHAQGGHDDRQRRDQRQALAQEHDREQRDLDDLALGIDQPDGEAARGHGTQQQRGARHLAERRHQHPAGEGGGEGGRLELRQRQQ